MLFFLRLFKCSMLIYLILQIWSWYQVIKNWYIFFVKLKLAVISREILIVWFVFCFLNIWTRFNYICYSYSSYDIFGSNSPWTRFSHTVGCILRVCTDITILISSSKTCNLLLLALNILNYSTWLPIVSPNITSCKVVSIVDLKMNLILSLALILLFWKAFACY